MNAIEYDSAWGEAIARRLVDSDTCPLCESRALDGGCCARCGADLRGPIGMELWNASAAAAHALRTRGALLGAVPRPLTRPPAPPEAQAAATPAVQPPPTVQAPPRSSATVQSVLAIAGAGLFAIAALIFTFLNPDL